MNTRTCLKCLTVKNLSNFPQFSSNCRLYRRNACKQCFSIMCNSKYIKRINPRSWLGLAKAKKIEFCILCKNKIKPKEISNILGIHYNSVLRWRKLYLSQLTN